MNFVLAAALVVAAIAAVGVVAAPQTIYSALSLVVTVIMLAVAYLALNAQFLFVVQLIVYAGAVMVLFVFIIALLDPASDERPRLTDPRLWVGTVAVVALTGAVMGAAAQGATMVGTHDDPYRTFSFPAALVNVAGNTQTAAGQLFTTYVVPFEVTSLLLLVAAIGAVYLTRAVREENAP